MALLLLPPFLLLGLRWRQQSIVEAESAEGVTGAEGDQSD